MYNALLVCSYEQGQFCKMHVIQYNHMIRSDTFLSMRKQLITKYEQKSQFNV